jgi:type I restriction enzyme, S subunit
MIEDAITIEEKRTESHWMKCKLSDICEIVTGKWDANHSVSNGNYRFYTCAYDYLYCDTKRFSGECLILPGNGANVGEVFYYNGEFDAYQRTYVIQNIKIVPKFLYYHLKLNWKKGTDIKQYGSATNYIRITNFIDYDIVYPNTSEQQQIVSQIEELFSELDKGIEQLKTAQQQLKVYRQAVLKWAFEGKLTNEDVKDGELPERWNWQTLSQVSDVSGGLTKNSKRESLEIKLPFLRVANVYFNDLDLAEMHTIGIRKAEVERVLLRKDDLLFVEGNGSIDQVGRTALWTGEIQNCVHQNHLIKARFSKEVHPKYALYFFCSNRGREKIKLQANSTSGLHTLSLSKISKLELPVCSIEEQQQIVQEIESRLSVCDKIEETIANSLKQAEALRQSILKKAFEGKLS